MLSQKQTYYLQMMGVQIWQERDVVKPKNTETPNALQELAKAVSACTACALHETRTQTVFSSGAMDAPLFIIGEAPGFYEDQKGFPFAGKAGELLNHILHAVGFSRENVYIANVLKCRPPGNRDPKKEEVIACSGFLERQIALIKPRLILALGRHAGHFLLDASLSLYQMRKKMHAYQDIPFMVSYHPAYLLRNPKDKKKAYEDWLAVKAFLRHVEPCETPPESQEALRSLRSSG